MNSREIEIEFRLTKQLSGSEFERFGNRYLRYFYKDQYPQTKLGLQIANNSTVTGQPDMYFSLPDHFFRFAEFTTKKGSLATKLKADLKSCLDESGHGIRHNQIKHIDLVYTGRLTARQQEEIAKPAQAVEISVTFHGIDQLVNAVIDDIRLAKALNMPIGTGQILTTDEFIEHYEYGRLTVGTPLSNTYIERAEYEHLADQLREFDIVIIQGPPGYGKTKLALEYQQHYLTGQSGSEGYCIIHQPPAIWEDVLTYFPDGKDYVILIDDANRQVENLLTVLSHFDKRLRNSTFKLLITVRSYAYEDVCESLRANAYRFSELTVGHMTDEQITEILKSASFNILNGHYHHKINRLAQGNVRLAIMLATLANREDSDITILSDVSAVYDEYYRRVMPDQTIWTDVTRLRVLGLTAVLRVVDTTNPTDIEPALAFLGITDTELWRHVRHLEMLEIVEVYQDNAFRFTEQVFATYAFYQCFFIRKASDLTQLLTTYNEKNGYRLKDAVLSVYENYNKEFVRAWVHPILTKFYAKLTHDKSRLNFLSMYDQFLAEEVIYFILDFVEGRVTLDYYDHYELKPDKKIVDLLFAYLKYTSRKQEAIMGYELMVALFNKQSITLEDISQKIESYLVHTHDFSAYHEYGKRYERYDWLSEYLVEKANLGSHHHCQLMDASLKHLLMLMYDEPGEPPIYRNRVWNYIDSRLSKEVAVVKTTVFEYMPKGYGDLDESEIQADINEIVKIIRKHFSVDNPVDCRNVHTYVNKLNKLALKRRSYQSLSTEFNGELYELYCTLNFEYIKKRERIEIDILGSAELRKRKIDEIQAALTFTSINEFEPLYEKIRLMWSLVVRNGDGWNISKGLTELFLSIAKQNDQLFTEVLKHVISVGLPESYMDHPPLLATIMERGYVRPENIYAILLPLTDKTSPWLYSFFCSLPDSKINSQWFNRLNNHLLNFVIYQPNRIAFLGFLKRYVAFDSTLPSRILHLLYDTKTNHGKNISLCDNFIEEFGSSIDLALTNILEELYLDQYFTKQVYDYRRKALAILIDRRRGFWLDFLSAHYTDGSSRHDLGELAFVWLRDDYYELVTEGLRLIKRHRVYMIHRQEVEGFFKKMSQDNAERTNQFLERFIRENPRDIDLLSAIYSSLAKPGPLTDKSFLTLFLIYNTSVEDFSQIDWIGSNGIRSGSAGTIFSDINVQRWEAILVQVEAMPNQLTYLPHKRYIKSIISHQHEQGNYERRLNFLRSR